MAGHDSRPLRQATMLMATPLVAVTPRRGDASSSGGLDAVTRECSRWCEVRTRGGDTRRDLHSESEETVPEGGKAPQRRYLVKKQTKC
jgi:hypothetical protein